MNRWLSSPEREEFALAEEPVVRQAKQQPHRTDFFRRNCISSKELQHVFVVFWTNFCLGKFSLPDADLNASPMVPEVPSEAKLSSTAPNLPGKALAKFGPILAYQS